ncbi:MAG: extracellular solute-binding protein [Deinococcota bacterium]
MPKHIRNAVSRPFSRRKFLQGSAATLGGLALGSQFTTARAQGAGVEFWSQPYGDTIAWKRLIDGLAETFTDETGIGARAEIINWANAGQTWLLTAQGGAHPDVGDMYWLHSNAGIGAGQHGPMPITQYKDEYFPDLEERFFTSALTDVTWNGDFYGIPWRGDIRPQIFRTDHLAEAGFDRAPATWEEITEYARALTIRDGNNVTRWGFNFGFSSNAVQQLMPYYWQAGGEFMSEDGQTATIDNDAMRTTLSWMHDLVWVHGAVDPNFMEVSSSPLDDFVAGSLAMSGSIPDNNVRRFEVEFPEIDGLWELEIPAIGPDNRAAYSGAGYWGLLYGTEKVEESLAWLQFLSRDENMQTITEYTSGVSPNKNVMASDFWQDRPWKLKIVETLEFGHTSQHPSPAWATISAGDPGGIVYDLMFNTVIRRNNIDDEIATAQSRMQAELDKV